MSTKFAQCQAKFMTEVSGNVSALFSSFYGEICKEYRGSIGKWEKEDRGL